MRLGQQLTTVLVLLSVVACVGTMPLPPGAARGSAVKQPTLSANSSPVSITGSATTALPPNSVATTLQDANQPVAVPLVESKPLPAPTESVFEVPIKQRLATAVRLLQSGEEANAKLHLNEILKEEPQHMVAKSLMKQIEEPAGNYLGTQHFMYTTKAGDTYSTLAKMYLKDTLKFYGLAKYNNMNDPSKLVRGMTIKIPGSSLRGEPIPVTTPREDKPNPEYLRAKKFYESGKYADAIVLLEQADKQAPGQQERITDLLVLVYAEYAKVLIKKADLLNAQTVLKKAIKIQPSNSKLHDQLASIENGIKAESYFEDGLKALQADDTTLAFKHFKAVLKFQPEHELARKHVSKIRPSLIDGFYKEGMKAYRRQDLDKAIGIWEQLLSLEPEHELAKLYRARAIELKERVQSLDKAN